MGRKYLKERFKRCSDRSGAASLDVEKPFASGNTADIYRDGDHVIKLLKPDFPHSDITFEAKKLKWAYEAGLKVPKVIDVTTINGQKALVMEYIAGEPLGEKMLANQERTEECLSSSVDIQIHLHQINADPLESMSDKLYRKIQSAPLISENQKEKLLSGLKRIHYDPKLCHGDFHIFNLLQTNEGIYIIDWIDATSGDIRADVYRTYLLYSQHDPELADCYLPN